MTHLNKVKTFLPVLQGILNLSDSGILQKSARAQKPTQKINVSWQKEDNLLLENTDLCQSSACEFENHAKNMLPQISVFMLLFVNHGYIINVDFTLLKTYGCMQMIFTGNYHLVSTISIIPQHTVFSVRNYALHLFQ